jgi:hypothetical protein
MMSTMVPPQVSVPCPVCGTPFVWPPTAPCGTCHADLAGPVATAFWDLARDIASLQERQYALGRELAAGAELIGAPPPPPHRQPRRLTGLSAQTILGLVGAALLAVAAVVFAAVTWQDLPALARGSILVAAAVTAVFVTRWLHTRELHVTAGATGLLADALVATVVWAAHTFGATGDLLDAGGGALAAAAASATAAGLAAWGIRWQRWATAGAWIAAAGFAAATIAEGGTAVAVVAAVLGLAGAALWLRFGGEAIGAGMATVTVTILGWGVASAVTLDDGLRLVAVALVGLAAVALATAVGAPRRLPILVGSLPVNLPVALVSTAFVVATAVGWVRTIGRVWSTNPVADVDTVGWLAAVPLVAAVSALVLVWGLRPARVRTTAVVVVPALASASAWWLEADVHTAALAVLAGLLALAGWLRLDDRVGRVAFVAGTVGVVGWLGPWAWLTALAAATVALVAVAARWAPLGRQVEHAAMTVTGMGLAAAATVVWLDASNPERFAGSVAVVVAVVVAAGAARLHGRLALHAPTMAVAVAVVGAVAAVATGEVAELTDAAITTGTLTVGGIVLAATWRREAVAMRISAATAALAATATSWLLLRAAEVDVPEAYTAAPAVLALVAGAVWMYRDPLVRSRRALHPGLLLAVAPTLVMLVGDVQDTTRALVAAGFAAVLLLVGTIRRIEVPIWYGLAAGIVVVTTQLAVVAGHVPRWTAFATLGAILVAASATFERQRMRAHRLGAAVRRVADDYR